MAKAQAQVHLVPAAPLPTTTEAYLAHRKWKRKRTINDLVEDIHVEMIEQEGYRKYWEAIYDEHAVEQSMRIDDVMAAQMIRAKAKEDQIAEVAEASLALIVKALRHVVAKYEFSRKQRREGAGQSERGSGEE